MWASFVVWVVPVLKKYWREVILVVLLGLIVLLWGSLRGSHSENRRLSNSLTAAMADVQYYKTQDGFTAAKIQALELNASEFERLCDSQATVIKNLGLKLNRVLSSSETSYEVSDSLRIPLIDKDTIFLRDTCLIARGFEYKDANLTLSGVVADSIFMSYNYTDTLYQVCYRVPRKFLFIRWGTKCIEQHIMFGNPNATVKYSRVVLLQKKKRS